MIIYKTIIAGIFLVFLNGCIETAALVAPTYQLASSGNAYQAGATLASNQAITSLTGKSTAENIKEILKPDENDTEFEKLVKKRVAETRKKLNLAN